MPEYSHHIDWLREVETRLSQQTPITDAERHKMIAICEKVLLQNSESTIAKSTLARINGIVDVVQNTVTIATESPKEKIAKKIVEVERGMESLASHMSSKINTARTPELRLALMNSFAFINANKENPFKNFEDLRERAEREGLPPQALALAMPDPRHFVYNVVDKSDLDSQGNMIGTNAIGRMVVMHERYDLTKISRQFTVYHEMVHLMHHAMQRKKNMPSFIQFYTNPNRRVIANEEFDAYGLQVEAMNLTLDDFFRKAATRGSAVAPAAIIREFQFEESETIPATFLSLMAKEYFMGDGDVSKGRHPERFKELIRLTIREDGAEVFEYGQPEVPKP